MSIGAMILAAGRGERLRPLSDVRPKPLHEAGGKPLIVWQIEALARAGLTDIVVNAAHLADQLVASDDEILQVHEALDEHFPRHHKVDFFGNDLGSPHQTDTSL